MTQNQIVVVDFTADWCQTCTANLQFAIETPDVIQLINNNNVLSLMADWTNGDSEVKQALLNLNYQTVPLFVIYQNNKPPIILPDLITETQVIERLQEVIDDRTFNTSNE